MKHTIIAAALAIASFSSAQAASINGLHNTGEGISGTADAYYTLTSSSVSNTVPTITSGSQWPINPWLANTDASKWITPTGAQGESLDPWSNGTYTYTLQFDLTGYNAASALFNARIAADNAVSVKLNTTSLLSNAVGFTNWSDFSAHSGFVAGVNTLEFTVTNYAQNGGNPSGLRIEFLNSNVAAVPEPETYAMLLGGLALVGAIARRRKQQ